MTYPSKVADLGATAHYRLGEASGTTITDSIGSANGTYVNTPDLGVTGAIRDGNTAVTFKSASAERGTLTTLGTFGSSLGTCSIALWVKSTTTAQTALLGAFNSGTATAIQFTANADGLGNASTGSTRFLIRNEAGTATRCHITTNLYDGNWHFLVAVTDGTVGWKIYVDGVAVSISTSSGTASGTYANLAVAMDIAARNNNGTHGSQFDGSLDEVAFFPTRLGADSAINLYYEGATKSSFGSTQTSGTYYTAVQALSPALYWRLDETAGSYYAKDISGNGKDGIYLGGDLSFNQSARVDGDTSFRATNEAGTGVVRALTYSPFQPNAQLTVVGVSKWDDVLDPPAGFQNFFADDTPASTNTGPVLEGGLTGSPATTPDSVVRWYGNVNGQIGKYVDFYGNVVPPQGSTRWFHWAFTYDDTTLTPALYINGALVPAHAGVLGAPSTGFATGGHFQIANRTGNIASTTENWQGQHDEIAVYERILSASEIRGLSSASGIAFWDSGTATVSLTLSGSGAYGYTHDSGSATAAITPTRTESQAGTDSRSISISLTLSASESWSHFPNNAFDDAGSVTVNLAPTATSAEAHSVSASASAPLAPTGVESYGFTGTGSASVGVAVSGTENAAQTGAQTASAALSPTGADDFTILDAGSATVPITLAGTHAGFTDSGLVTIPVTPTGSPRVFDDSGTVTVAVHPTGTAQLPGDEITGLFGAESGHLESDGAGHLEFATAGRTS